MSVIVQDVLELPEIECYKNFEGNVVEQLPIKGHVKVISKRGIVYSVRLNSKTRYNELKGELVACIDTDTNPWIVTELRRRE